MENVKLNIDLSPKLTESEKANPSEENAVSKAVCKETFEMQLGPNIPKDIPVFELGQPISFDFSDCKLTAIKKDIKNELVFKRFFNRFFF